MALSSCTSDLTDLNIDPKHPTVLPSANLMAKGQQQQFYYTYTGSVNYNNFKFFTQMWAETTYTDETNYDIVTRNQPRNNFNVMYNGVLNNYEQAKKNLVAEGGDANKMATLEIAEISAWETIVDTYGDVPYTQALQASTGQFAPAYDDAKSIYTDLFKRINAVIPTITAGTGYSEDLVYGGDMMKWKKLANSIKLRLALNLDDTDHATAKAAGEAAYASGLMTSDADSYALAFPGGLFSNPLFDDLIASGRKDFVPSELVVNMMNAKMDPRRPMYFTTVGGAYVGGVFGDGNPYPNYSHYQETTWLQPTAPATLLSYTEVLFMLTEAAARGYSVGGTADTWYKMAVTNSMNEYGVAAGDTSAYLLAHPYDAANWKKSIGEEAYIALHNRGFAEWNFSRRLDYPVFVNPTNSRLDGVPVRMPYSDQEYVLNKGNVTAAASKIGGDKATTKLFWDKF
ncbi:SusD/RagB family nutrient-binding outer membrane lipoprotein [Halpernia humi]|nr:SusD/RagB family nutrient-binding outer membrane lipoprotein [Halpernia humi]